jgi:nitrogenase molybdenum-iron protein alpha chain
MGVYSKQLHSYDYAGPYAGFKGAVNFARDVAAGIFTPHGATIVPPWKKEPTPSGNSRKETTEMLQLTPKDILNEKH